jgi:hypothetical protein
LGAGRKKFERRSLPLFSNLFWGEPGKQNDAVPQGAIGVFPEAVTEYETGLYWGDAWGESVPIAHPAHAIPQERNLHTTGSRLSQEDAERYRYCACFGLYRQAEMDRPSRNNSPPRGLLRRFGISYFNSSPHLTLHQPEHDRFPRSRRTDPHGCSPLPKSARVPGVGPHDRVRSTERSRWLPPSPNV